MIVAPERNAGDLPLNGRFPFLLLTCSPAATSSFGSENAGIAGLRPLLDNGNAAIVKTQFVRKTTERCGEKETLKGENNGAVEWLKDKKLLCVCVSICFVGIDTIPPYHDGRGKIWRTGNLPSALDPLNHVGILQLECVTCGGHSPRSVWACRV